MRGRDILLVAHCCLDQNAVLPGWERAIGAYPFMTNLLDEGIGVIQLPCPETLALGINRPSMGFDEYNTEEHRSLCDTLCDIPLKMVEAHLSFGDRVIGMIGIQESPNCALSGVRGVFMEAFVKKLEEREIHLPFLEVPTDYIEGETDSEDRFETQIENWLNKTR